MKHSKCIILKVAIIRQRNYNLRNSSINRKSNSDRHCHHGICSLRNRCLSLSLSLFFSVSTSLSPSLSIFVSPSLSGSLYVCVSPFLYSYFCLSTLKTDFNCLRTVVGVFSALRTSSLEKFYVNGRGI